MIIDYPNNAASSRTAQPTKAAIRQAERHAFEAKVKDTLELAQAEACAATSAFVAREADADEPIRDVCGGAIVLVSDMSHRLRAALKAAGALGEKWRSSREVCGSWHHRHHVALSFYEAGAKAACKRLEAELGAEGTFFVYTWWD